MAQRLILPIVNCQLNAGYKSTRYKKDWGFVHYGVDLIERLKQRRVYSMGDGMVVACGMDGTGDKDRLGNCIVLVYNDVLLPDGRVMGLACRMYHLAKIICKVGDKVKAGTQLGEYGSTGAYSSGPHLHMEFDSDTKYPSYAVGLARDGKVIRRGTVDSTVDPCKVLWLGTGQVIYTPPSWIADGWVAADSLKLPRIPATGGDGEPDTVTRLEDENSKLRELLVAIHSMSDTAKP